MALFLEGGSGIQRHPHCAAHEFGKEGITEDFERAVLDKNRAVLRGQKSSSTQNPNSAVGGINK
jgi:hypothetical protein